MNERQENNSVNSTHTKKAYAPHYTFLSTKCQAKHWTTKFSDLSNVTMQTRLQAQLLALCYFKTF